MACYARYRNRTSSTSTTTPVPQTSPLLTLPRELRDHILTYLLEGTTRQPSPLHAPYTTRRRSSFRHTVYYPPYRSFRYPPIIWTCRQLRTETFQLALQRGIRPAEVELDLLFKGREVWPTYTYLPAVLLRGVPFDLTVQVRILSTEAFLATDAGGVGVPGSAFGDLLWLLNTLLHNGPSHVPGTDRMEGLYRINRLRVEVSFQDYYTPATHPDTVGAVFKCLKLLARDGLKPGIVGIVEAHASFQQQGNTVERDGAWEVAEECDETKWPEWNELGYFCPAQIYSRSSRPDDSRES